MSIRYLIAAAFLLGSACGAQADVLRGGQLTSWNGKGVHAVASNYAAPAASHGGSLVDTATPDWNTHGNGATVITPAQGGQSGGAIVTLPAPAQGRGPVSAPALPAAEPAAAVPEPSSIALMMAGMMGALGIARRRKR